MKFRAHDTFFIRKGWLSKGMKHIEAKPDVFISKENNPMDILGIGSNMVKALRYWLQATGISEEPNSGRRIQNFTKLGEEIFENDIFLDEEEEYTSIWRHEQLSTKKHLVEIDLFIRQTKDDNLFRKYNDLQYKFIYDFAWIIETAQKNGFEVVDTASNPEFGESRIFFVLKKL